MSQPARISVILTSYNHAEFLRESIESVLNQTYPHFELIIMDDASTDGSWDIIQSYSDPRIRAYRKEANQGGWLPNDVLSGMETAEYIAIHHCDDVWEPQKLEKQLVILDEQPQVGAVFSWAQVIDEYGRPLEKKSHFYYKVFEQPNRSRFDWLHYFFYHSNALCHPSVLIRRKCYDDCGLYRYGLAQLGDFDMWVRLCLKYEIHVIPEKLVRFRLQSSEINTSGDRPDVHIRGEFEFLQIYQNYLQITNRDDFVKVFPDAVFLVEKDEYDIPFSLAMTALSLMNPFGRLFGLQVLFEIINNPEHARKVQRIYGFRNMDFIRLTAIHDIFSVVARSERDAQLQTLFQQLLEKEASMQAAYAKLQETSDQLVEKDLLLNEILSSKVYKVALLLRRIRLVLVPPNSRRADLLRRILLVGRNGKWKKERDLIRSSPYFDADWYLANNPDVAKAKLDPASHYLMKGGVEGRDPGPEFSSSWYLEMYKDVKGAGMNPLLHYLEHGQKEGRAATAADLRTRSTSVYKDYKAIVSNPKNKDSSNPSIMNRVIRAAFAINQRLPLTETGRQKLQRFVYRVSPNFFYRYKRSVNSIASEKYFGSAGSGYRHSSSSVRDLFESGQEAPLALWSYLLKVDEAALRSLLVPAWQVKAFEGAAAAAPGKEPVAIADPSLAPLHILLVVSHAPAHFLHDCIRSIQEQTCREWQLDIFVCEDGLWNPEVLAVTFEEDARIRVRRVASQGEIPGQLEQCARESTGRYLLFLSQYDRLEQGALAAAASELQDGRYELIYSPPDLPVQAIAREGPALGPGIPGHEFAFPQLILWKKEYLEDLLREEEGSPAQGLIRIGTRMRAGAVPGSVKVLPAPYYAYREIPGRTGIQLVEKDGKLDLVFCSLPMRVLLDGRLLGRKTTGTERYIWELLKELALLRREYDLELKVITISEPEAQIEGVEFLTAAHIEAIHRSHIFHKTFPASDAGTLAEMGIAPAVIYSPLDMILYSNPDYFFSETDYYHFRKTMQMAVKLSDHIISISNHGKHEMEDLLDVPGDRITPVYLGVHPEHFSMDQQVGRSKLDKLKVPSDYFLFVGTNYPHKNLITLLRAFKIVHREIPSANLVLVGTSHYDHPQPELDSLSDELSDRILHLGHIPDDVLPTLYHSSRALVYPSLHEGFGLPLLEAMLCGTAVIASDSTSIPEVCGEEAAILVNGRDEQQIAEAMIRVWKDPDLRDRLVAAGLRNAVRFTWESTARQTLRCYQNAVQKAMQEPAIRRVNEKAGVINQLGIDPPTILIATHIRFYPPTAGNELRMLRLVKHLKKLGYRIVMLVNPFLEKSALDRNARSALHRYVDYYEEIGDTPIERVIDLPLQSEIGNEPVLGRWRNTEETFCSDAVLQRAARLIEEFSPRIIIAQYIWMSRIFALAGPDVLKVIDTIDMFSRKNESVVKFGIDDTLAATPAEELAFLNRSDVTIAIQESEAEAFRKLAPSCRIITAGIDLDVGLWRENAAVDSQSPTLLIVGSGNQINVHCVTEFLEQVWPRIHQQVPSSRLRIIGKVTDSLSAQDPSVELIRYVPDLDAEYEQAAVVVNPVYAGTGIKVKSIEALGHSKAFVCWPEGAAGLTSRESNPFIIVQNWDELAASVIDLFQNPQKRKDLEQAAWNFARTKLSDRYIYRETVDCFDSFSGRKLKVLCLYLRYGLNDHPQGLADLQDWYTRKMAGAEVTTWIIDNKLQTEVDGTDLATGLRLLSGDNRQREFSGFQKILREHREEIEKYEVVHFVTSAFNTLFTGYLDYFQVEDLVPVAHRPLCLGHIDAYDEPVHLAGETSQSWIRTCFFFMSPESVYSIPSVVSFTEESQFFDTAGRFKDSNVLSENYRQSITAWLSGETIQGVTWHSKISSPKSFAGKTMAILNEHMLAIQYRNAGVDLIDYYWIRDHRRVLQAAIDHPIPDTLEQVRYRQEHLFGVPGGSPVRS